MTRPTATQTPIPPRTTRFERLRIGLRVAYRVPFLFFWSLFSFLLCAAVVDRRLRSRVGTLWGRGLLFGLGFRIHRNKTVRGKGLIILPTHTSYADIPVVQACFDGHFVATVDIKRWPLFGWGNTLVGSVYVERGKHGMVEHLVEKGTPMLRQGRNLFIFGEGKSSSTPVLPLKRGAFVLSERSGAPIVPVVIRFGEPEKVGWAIHGEHAQFRYHVVRFLGTVKNRRIDVAVLPPVTADMFPDQETFRASVRDAMQRVYDDPSMQAAEIDPQVLYGLAQSGRQARVAVG